MGCSLHFLPWSKLDVRYSAQCLRENSLHSLPTGNLQGRSKVMVWLHQGNTQAVQSLWKGQATKREKAGGPALAVGRRRGPSSYHQSQINQCPLEFGKVRCCFPVGQESSTSTWVLETGLTQIVNEEQHTWGKNGKTGFPHEWCYGLPLCKWCSKPSCMSCEAKLQHAFSGLEFFDILCYSHRQPCCSIPRWHTALCFLQFVGSKFLTSHIMRLSLIY